MKVAPLYVIGIDAPGRRMLLAPPKFRVDHPKDAYGNKTAATKQEAGLRNKLVIATIISKRYAHKFISTAATHIDTLHKLYMPDAPEYAKAIFNNKVGEFVVWKDSPHSLFLKHKNCMLEYINFLSDEEFIKFGTMDHLSRLALTFDKSKDLLAVLESRKPARMAR